jgi:hypothetical protein
MGLVSRCSDTLESLSISYYTPGALPSASTSGQHLTTTRDVDTSGAPPIDLSKVTKLKNLSFRCGGSECPADHDGAPNCPVQNLQQITIRPRVHLCNQSRKLSSRVAGPRPRIVQFWNSHSIRPKITYEVDKRGNDLRAFAPSLLPELTRRGLVDLVESPQDITGPLLFVFV